MANAEGRDIVDLSGFHNLGVRNLRYGCSPCPAVSRGLCDRLLKLTAMVGDLQAYNHIRGCMGHAVPRAAAAEKDKAT